ncbi:unnamed protein product [Dicrocoelium dendriticum]|nr:unnamed protein product [Dicrocoelium dendriticum]
MISQVAASVTPVRRLFTEISSDAEERVRISARCQDEAKEACHRSTERLRELFNFDVDTMISVRTESTPLKKTALTPMPTRSTSTPAPSPARDIDLPQWKWEEISLHCCYVPQFYHARHYHSDTDLRVSARGAECTENKTHSTRARDQAVTAENPKTPTVPSFKETNSMDVSTLYNIWCARIRRASHTERETKETKAFLDKLKRPLSTGRIPSTVPLAAISVPVNSPVKHISRNPFRGGCLPAEQVMKTGACQRSANELKIEAGFQFIAKGEESKDCTSHPCRYRQLTIFDCTRWKLTPRSSAEQWSAC